MMKKRLSAQMEGEFVVFLIGMRVNRWWLFWRWLRVSLAMPRMQKELEQHPELGYLGGEQWFGRTTIMVTYWKSIEHLMEYARNPRAEHLPAWRAFNQRIGTNGDVGIWHETYRVQPGNYETMYVNMNPFGLGKAGKLVEATGKRERAEGRMAASANANANAA